MRRKELLPLLALAVSLLLAACAGPLAESGAQPPGPAAPEASQEPQPLLPSPSLGEGEPTGDPAPTPDELAVLAASLESQGPAPELHNQVWLNSQPLKLADLRGQVVIVEFWTYG